MIVDSMERGNDDTGLGFAHRLNRDSYINY